METANEDIVKRAHEAPLKALAPELRDACVVLAERLGEALELDPAELWMLVAGAVLDKIMES